MRYRTLIAIAIIGGLIGLWLSPGRAYSHQPYGGCDEAWQAPRSAGAQHCRDHGWFVSGNLVVGPHGVVRYSSLPRCANEDTGRLCSWNFTPGDGDSRGLAYWFDRNRDDHHVWPADMANTIRYTKWRWLTDRERATFREHYGPIGGGMTYRMVAIRVGDTTHLRAPNGWHRTS